MGFAHDAAKAVGHALESVRAGTDKLASRKLAAHVKPTISVSSTAFPHGGRLPVSCTADGEGAPPQLRWGNVPIDTKSVVLICEDPDAPFPEPYVHWLVYGIPTTETRVNSHTVRSLKQGKNSKMARGFAGAAPPPGHGLHHYHFQVFALDVEPNLEANEGRGAVLDAMKNHIIGWGELIGTYERS